MKPNEKEERCFKNACGGGLRPPPRRQGSRGTLDNSVVDSYLDRQVILPLVRS